MKIHMRVKAFIILMGIAMVSGCSKEQAEELQTVDSEAAVSVKPEDFAEKIEEYKSHFIELYTSGADGEAAIIVEERAIAAESSEGAVVFVYTDIDGKGLRYRIHAYGETGNAVINYYLCDGFVWISKQTDYYSSYILTAEFSDTLFSGVENWILTEHTAYILHDDGEVEEIGKNEVGGLEELLDECRKTAGSSELPEAAKEYEPTEYEALFQQELLFLQQGLRQHDVEGNYTVYFVQPEEQPDQLCYQDMLLEGEEGFWHERLSYTYDGNQDWYTFSGEYEPVLTKNLFYTSDNDNGVEKFKDDAVYQAELSAKTDLEAPLRFDIPSGPVIYDDRRAEGKWGDDLYTYVYVYQDERLGVSVEIEYPQYSLYADELPKVEEVNQRIKEAFFYGYGLDNEKWDPAGEMYGDIYRNCEITRADDRYFSMCIYEYNSFRGANHPNEWKSGMTIDLQTGEILTLRDVIGPERTVEELTDTGAFHCLQIWRDGDMSPEMLKEADQKQVEEARGWVDADAADDFYLTPDKLGLTSSVARYYVCMEAPLSEIGLESWIDQ